MLHNGLGDYHRAFAAAGRACEHDDLGLFGWALIELVEAAVRSGQPEAAAAALKALAERTGTSGTEWALGIEARSRALLRDGPVADEALTAQEAQVARLAAEGHTNPEIGARLFISPRTAEYHLHKVFSKLGVSSRRQLRHHLALA